jgi:hypothetical protein
MVQGISFCLFPGGFGYPWVLQVAQAYLCHLPTQREAALKRFGKVPMRISNRVDYCIENIDEVVTKNHGQALVSFIA